MKTRDFFFDLPEELIAQFPSDRREESRLLCLSRADGAVSHRRMTDLPSLLPEGAVLVVNDSRVLPARLHCLRSETGGRVELLRSKPGETVFKITLPVSGANKG